MLLQLQEYDYYFTFRPGKLHHAADALTRLPTSEDTLAEEITLLETSEQLYFFDLCNDHSKFDRAELNSLQIPISSSSQPPISLEQSISLEQFKMEQRKDLELNPLFEYLEHNNLTGDYKVDAQTIALSRYLTIQNDLLFHFQNLTGSNRYPRTVQQLVVPASLTEQVISLIHAGDMCGHPGVKKTFEKLDNTSIGKICSITS